jgi:uncharacterized protein YbjT (DUF2867 family)
MYAVAGVTGQTGAAVARALLVQGAKVRVIVRRAEAGAAWKALGADVALADLADAHALAAALRGAQGAYLLNPPSYVAADPFADAAAVGAALAAAIEASAVPRTVVLSSVAAQVPVGTGIIGTAHRVEQALAGVRSPLALLRASYFFENWLHVLQPVRESGVLPSFLHPVTRKLPMTPVADIGAAAASLLLGPTWQGKRTFELASFEASTADVANAFAAVLGKPVAPLAVPRDQWAGSIAANGFSPAVTAAFVGMYDGFNDGTVTTAAQSQPLHGTTTLAAAARALLA